MKKFLVTLLMFPFVFKAAFLYIDERDSFRWGSSKLLRPTYRVSTRIYPNPDTPKLTMAVSEITKDGAVKPYGVVTLINHH